MLPTYLHLGCLTKIMNVNTSPNSYRNHSFLGILYPVKKNYSPKILLHLTASKLLFKVKILL